MELILSLIGTENIVTDSILENQLLSFLVSKWRFLPSMSSGHQIREAMVYGLFSPFTDYITQIHFENGLGLYFPFLFFFLFLLVSSMLLNLTIK